MHPHRLGLSCRLPLTPAVLEIPDQFLLLRIHRKPRLAPVLKVLTLLIQILKLRVAVRMRRPFARLLEPLQAVVQLSPQDLTDGLGTDLPSLPLEFGADLPPAFGGPFQRPHRIAPRRRIDDRLDRFQQPRLPLHGRLASPARSPLPAPRQHALTRLSWTFPLQFAPPLDHRLLTHRQRLGHGSNPALSITDRLAAGSQPSPPFI